MSSERRDSRPDTTERLPCLRVNTLRVNSGQ